MLNAELDYQGEQVAGSQFVGSDNSLSVARLIQEAGYPELTNRNSRPGARSEAASTHEISFNNVYDSHQSSCADTQPKEMFSVLGPRELIEALRNNAQEKTTKERLIERAEQLNKLGLANNEEVRKKTGMPNEELEKIGFSDKKVNELLERNLKAIEELNDQDLKNIDAFLTAAKKGDVKTMGEIVSCYRDNPEHFANAVQLGIRFEADNRYGYENNFLYSSKTNMIGVPVKSDHGNRTFFHPNGSTTRDLWEVLGR